MNSGPKRKEVLTYETIKKVVSDMHSESKLTTVVFAGGEPTIYKGLLLKSIELCRDLQINSRLITNVSWAKTEKKALEMLTSLRKSGLDEINFSFDDYHLPYINENNIKIAWNAAKDIGFKSVIIATVGDDNSKITPDYIDNLIGEKLARRFDDSNFYEKINNSETFFGLSNGLLQNTGRASTNLSVNHSAEAKGVHYLTCPNVLAMPTLDSSGRIVACCGYEIEEKSALSLGDVSYQDTRSIIENANKNIFIKALHFLGPGIIIKFLEYYDRDIIKEEKHANICSICNSITSNEKAMELLYEKREDLMKYIIEKSIKN